MATNTVPKYLYVLFNDGARMNGNYGRVFFDRVSARKQKQKANKSSKINGHVTIGRVQVGTEWETVR
tara:strand:+ start:426 stop:626 length:201 start_codon:yes stop_codon:yes gene_type:complete